MSRTAAELPRLASPDSIAELSELMARAHAESRTVTVFGGGTAFDDHPPAATPGLLIDMTGLAEEIGRATSELQSRGHLVCRLLLEKKKKKKNSMISRSNRSKRMYRR